MTVGAVAVIVVNVFVNVDGGYYGDDTHGANTKRDECFKALPFGVLSVNSVTYEMV